MDRFTALLLTIKVAKLFCAFINGCQNLFRTLQYLVTETSRTAEPGALQKFYHVSVTLLSIVWLEAASRCFLHTAEAAHCSCDLEEVQQHLHSVSASAINIEVIMPERGGLTNRNKIPPHILPRTVVTPTHCTQLIQTLDPITTYLDFTIRNMST